MIFCPKCGTQNPDGAAFCGSCGEPLQGRSPAPAPTPAQAPAPQAQPVYGAPMGQAAPTAGGPAMAGQSPTPVINGGAAAAQKNKMPLLIGLIVAAVAVVLLLVLFVMPRCSGGAGFGGSGIDMHTLNTGKASEAQAVLKNLKSGTIEEGSEELTYYASSDKMISYVDELVNDAMNGNVREWSDIIDQKKAQELNGEWVLLSAADDSLQELIEQAGGSQSVYDLSHMALYATVVNDGNLSNEKVANIVAGAGVQYQHAQVADMKMDDALGFMTDYASALSGLYGSSSSTSSIKQMQSAVDELGAKSCGFGSYVGKDQMAFSVSMQFDGYAIVALWADSPSSIDGMDKIYNEEFVNRMYVK